MKLINMTCPNCGSKLTVNKEDNECICESCGVSFLIDDNVQHVQYDNAEEAGYQFEKGRQKAQRDNARNTVRYQTQTVTRNKKKSSLPIWVWVMLWTCFLPFTAMYFIYKSNLPRKWKLILITGIAILMLVASVKSCIDEVNAPPESSEDNNSVVLTELSATSEESVISTEETELTIESTNYLTVESVDDSLRIFHLSITRTREDTNNIGDDWGFIRQINGEPASSGEYTVSVGDNLEFYVRCTEDDDNPEVGETTVTHTVSQDDFDNGFEIILDTYVTENGGRNSGQSAHFITTFTFGVE